MAYKLDYLPLAANDILEAEAGLFEFSPSAAEKFYKEVLELEERLCNHPLMYPVYKQDDFYRTVNLSYNYILFAIFYSIMSKNLLSILRFTVCFME